MTTTMLSPLGAEPALSLGLDEAEIWPSRRTEILDWLIRQTHQERFVDVILQELCERLLAMGVPVARATLHLRVQHPQWQGARILWRKGAEEMDLETFGHGTLEGKDYQDSPVAEIHRGTAFLRERLTGPSASHRYDLFDTLRQDGLTDYAAWPIEHTLGRQHVVTFASDAPGGFSNADIEMLSDLVPAIAVTSEVRLKNRLARTLLETYVGPHAADQILAGAITRGSGSTVAAAIMVCDMRDFTSISEMWPRDDVIDLLNGYFDAMCEPIEAHGGEILKFIGDGLLAIFPLDRPSACADLLKAVAEAQRSMAALNDRLVADGREPLDYGIGVHVGDVMYGNIGSRKRLDFTVIGPAVNTASRLESLTKVLRQRVLVSRAFAEKAGCFQALESLGRHALRGLDKEVEVFAFKAETCEYQTQ